MNFFKYFGFRVKDYKNNEKVQKRLDNVSDCTKNVRVEITLCEILCKSKQKTLNRTEQSECTGDFTTVLAWGWGMGRDREGAARSRGMARRLDRLQRQIILIVVGVWGEFYESAEDFVRYCAWPLKG